VLGRPIFRCYGRNLAERQVKQPLNVLYVAKMPFECPIRQATSGSGLIVHELFLFTCLCINRRLPKHHHTIVAKNRGNGHNGNTE
jgi:hypothetical protein